MRILIGFLIGVLLIVGLFLLTGAISITFTKF